MNFLAHLYLSGNTDQIKVGNFIADWVKGNKYNNYPKDIKHGILIHRNIDTYTDRHPIVLKHIRYFRENYSKYAGIVVDMLYDYLLAKSWERYSPIPLKEYTAECYQILNNYHPYLPAKVQYILPFIVKSDRLYSYSTLSGIADSLNIMSRNTSLPQHTQYAIDVLKDNMDTMEKDFELFFRDIANYIVEKFAISLPNITST